MPTTYGAIPISLAYLALALFLVDTAVSRWSAVPEPGQKRARPVWLRNVLYLLTAYLPIAILPLLSPTAITIVAGLTGLAALVSFARMVGLSQYPAFYWPTLLAAASFFVVTQLHWYNLFQAMPVFAMGFLVAVAALAGDSQAVLQKLCLGWVGLLVYGYLWAHAGIFVDTDLHALGSGSRWLVIVLLLAKCGDLGYALVDRIAPGSAPRLQLLVTPLAATAGGFLVGMWRTPEVPGWLCQLLGLVVGLGLAFASAGYKLVVVDVLGADGEATAARPLKSTMLFGFAFALGLGYHLVRYAS